MTNRSTAAEPHITNSTQSDSHCDIELGGKRYQVRPCSGYNGVNVWTVEKDGVGEHCFEALNRECAVARLIRSYEHDQEMVKAKARKAGKSVTIVNPQGKTRKTHGVTYEGAVFEGTADIVVNRSIRIHGSGKKFAGTEHSKVYNFDRSYKIGSTAEYDSYNKCYFGEILSITAKCVTIRERDGRKHRLTIQEFCGRNYNGLEAKYKRNAEWYD